MAFEKGVPFFCMKMNKEGRKRFICSWLKLPRTKKKGFVFETTSRGRKKKEKQGKGPEKKIRTLCLTFGHT